MASHQELIELQLAQLASLRRDLILATDTKVKFKLQHDIEEGEARLRSLQGETPAAKPIREEVLPAKEAPVAPISSSSPPVAKAQSTATAVPWGLITAVSTVVTFLLAWWMLSSAKLAALLALVVGLWLLFRNPELIYQRLALTAIGLVVVLNAINFSGFLDGKVGENKFRLELNEPDIIVSLALLAFAGYMMFLHSRR